MESWWIRIRSDGWKYFSQAWLNIIAGDLDKPVYYWLSISFQDTKIIFNQQNQSDCTGKVKVVDWLKYYLTSLLKTFNNVIPQNWLVQGKDLFNTHYGFGDALGSGFGAPWEDGSGRIEEILEGNLGKNMAGNSSNLRELNKPIETLEILASEGSLTGV